MSDDVKDFAYYAAKAEVQITRAAEYDDQIYNPHLRATALAAADVYARLACGAPEQAAQRMEIHQADCPCLPR